MFMRMTVIALLLLPQLASADPGQQPMIKSEAPKPEHQKIAEMVEALIFQKVRTAGAVTESDVRHFYDVAKMMSSEKKNREDEELKKDSGSPNPLYRGFTCIKNCENRTGFVDVDVRY